MNEFRKKILKTTQQDHLYDPDLEQNGGFNLEDSPYIELERGGPKKEVRIDSRKRIVRSIIAVLSVVLIAELVLIYQLDFRLKPAPQEIPAKLLVQAVEPTAVLAAEPAFPIETPYPVEEIVLPAEPPPLNEFTEPPMLELGVLEIE